jgi:hypothetical protein
MKSLLTIGVVAGVLTIIGGVLGQRWIIGAGIVVLLLVIIVLPWYGSAEPGAGQRDR